MQKDFRKWATVIVAFLLCFSFVVNVHCVMLVYRYREIYMATPVWVNDAGEYVVSASADSGIYESSDNRIITEDTKEKESEKELFDSENSEETFENNKEPTQTNLDTTGNTVYLTKSGTKFHRDGCSSLAKSKIPISYEDATARGFEPCGRCNP